MGKITGGNKRQILVVVHPEPDSPTLQFLGKVLAASKIDVNEDILLASANEGQAFSLFDLVRELQVRTVLIFGLSPKACGLNLHIKLYQPLTHNGIQLLLNNELAEIAANQQLKRHLWSALQQIFPKSDA